jgi:hypothetical protein
MRFGEGKMALVRTMHPARSSQRHIERWKFSSLGTRLALAPAARRGGERRRTRLDIHTFPGDVVAGDRCRVDSESGSGGLAALRGRLCGCGRCAAPRIRADHRRRLRLRPTVGPRARFPRERSRCEHGFPSRANGSSRLGGPAVVPRRPSNASSTCSRKANR